ncbi:uncharacterized protein LOC128672668 [Plodia interpunctella]|uniref:uncharacterized protein LOC128672668 n=1 Tax=Plodia interpunctella TaxID=58824 RepID=UPI0023686F2C|nr:uncharacterized protein LOC128672668 [Plodia interpunctella]
MDRKLTYFHLNGYAESIRYMLHYAGLEFQDIRLERASWPIKEIKDGKSTQHFLTWADFVLVGIIETANLFLNAQVEKKYPSIVALINHIRSLPGVKEYIATRKPYSV